MALFYSLFAGLAFFLMLYHYMQRFLDWFRFQSLGTRDYIVEICGTMFIEVTPNQVLGYLIACSAGPFVLSFLLFLPKVTPGLVVGTVLAVLGWKLPKPIMNMIYQARIERFNLQMVDGLGLMANAMKSGLSVVQAMGIVVEQMPNPMSQEFNLVLAENKVGVTVEEAFDNLAKRVKCEDVEMFVTAVNILKETGGNLAETFDTIVYVIRERLKVENKIKSLTAQGYYQGMMLLMMPVLLGLYFTFSEPGFMDPMFESPIGWGIMTAVFILEVCAYVVINKVITVDV
ncbi:MAG: type II secretion system F family protein [Deltaproteobacteria bacterium]|nr:type II secretion system F family protein [Deltaproteobacteria bacterium]